MARHRLGKTDPAADDQETLQVAAGRRATAH
jgi:hypothetical protein